MFTVVAFYAAVILHDLTVYVHTLTPLGNRGSATLMREIFSMWGKAAGPKWGVVALGFVFPIPEVFILGAFWGGMLGLSFVEGLHEWRVR